ncbi:unnamed protein product [Schistosoma margrebowiei]|uniref:Uncharacterized protein n=1 Tax=Schistosoma margrebowiei TaxID=48269 RepID=A0A183LDE1_9TREM|nr:unnamed protein product [Schistosoma margrebowiei]
MDYTLAQYKSPQYEELAFNIIKNRLIKLGYPPKTSDFVYDPSFPLRLVESSITYSVCDVSLLVMSDFLFMYCLWFDRLYGTLLKMDQFGNILSCLRGFNFIQREELRSMYPNKFVKYDEKRIEIMNTLFSLPETYILSCIIHMFVNDPDYIKVEHGVKKGSLYMSYASIYEDVRTACDWMWKYKFSKYYLQLLVLRMILMMLNCGYLVYIFHLNYFTTNHRFHLVLDRYLEVYIHIE